MKEKNKLQKLLNYLVEYFDVTFEEIRKRAEEKNKTPNDPVECCESTQLQCVEQIYFVLRFYENEMDEETKKTYLKNKPQLEALHNFAEFEITQSLKDNAELLKDYLASREKYEIFFKIHFEKDAPLKFVDIQKLNLNSLDPKKEINFDLLELAENKLAELQEKKRKKEIKEESWQNLASE